VVPDGEPGPRPPVGSVGRALSLTSFTNASSKEDVPATLATGAAAATESGSVSSMLLLLRLALDLVRERCGTAGARAPVRVARMRRPAAREFGTCGAMAASKAASKATSSRSSSRSADTTAQRAFGPQRDMSGGRLG
jgi:hypothetical protein